MLRWPLPCGTGNYNAHLAREDDMSPWVLSSIHIQRFYTPTFDQTWEISGQGHKRFLPMEICTDPSKS
jgi:hypothetical protein